MATSTMGQNTTGPMAKSTFYWIAAGLIALFLIGMGIYRADMKGDIGAQSVRSQNGEDMNTAPARQMGTGAGETPAPQAPNGDREPPATQPNGSP